MTSIPAGATAAPQDYNFTRNATGLVREVSMWDALIMNTLGMNVAVGSVLLLLQAPAIFPGGNMVLAVVIGTLIVQLPQRAGQGRALRHDPRATTGEPA